MECRSVTISDSVLRKLLGAANSDAALLYLYVIAGNASESAAQSLRMTPARVSSASAVLRQLGLMQEEKNTRLIQGERPNYTEADVTFAVHSDGSFRGLYEEVERVLGRNLTVEELKILLGFVRYLGLPPDVVITLVHYCRSRIRMKGSSRNPSLRMIEKEAYTWADKGIDTLEEASAYIQAQNIRNSRIGALMELLQIRGRNLTPAEERYAGRWLDAGFEEEVFSMAYERTCLNTGGLNWAYMDKILTNWSKQGLLTVAAVRNGDRKPERCANKPRQVDEDEAEAIRRMMQEG